MDIPVILTSAAVGTIVGTIIASTFTVISQFFERRSRRDELLIKAATELTFKFIETATSIAKEYHKELIMPPYSWSVYEFHRNLNHLMKHHKLPPDEQRRMEEDLKKHGITIQ